MLNVVLHKIYRKISIQSVLGDGIRFLPLVQRPLGFAWTSFEGLVQFCKLL